MNHEEEKQNEEEEKNEILNQVRLFYQKMKHHIHSLVSLKLRKIPIKN